MTYLTIMKYIYIYAHCHVAQGDAVSKELEKPVPDPSSEELTSLKGSLQTSLNEAVSELQQAQP